MNMEWSFNFLPRQPQGCPKPSMAKLGTEPGKTIGKTPYDMFHHILQR